MHETRRETTHTIEHTFYSMLQALILVFCGQLSKPEVVMGLNQIVLQNRMPLRTITFPWSFNSANLQNCFDVILLVLNAKKGGTEGQRNQQVICPLCCVPSMAPDSTIVHGAEPRGVRQTDHLQPAKVERCTPSCTLKVQINAAALSPCI